MSKKSRRDWKREGAPRKGRRRLRYVIVGAGVVLAITAMAVYNQQANPYKHPTPRGDFDHAAHLVPAERYIAYPRVATVYQEVAAAPQVIDGIFCYCMCSDHSDHYSLLDCFFSDHAARCDICLSEATMAFQMSRDGHDLKAIRAEIDRRFQS